MSVSTPAALLRAFAVAWAMVGWSAVLAFAIVRLSAVAAEAWQFDFTLPQWLVLIVNSLLMLWAEGYRGFQRRFSPRAAARVLHLHQAASPLHAALAPAFCVGLVGATPRMLRMTWIGAGLIVLAVLVVQRFPQPWRGIFDVGVVLGLSWGLHSFLQLTVRALRSGAYPVDPAVPGSTDRVASPL
jgi:hypothetical protein